MMAQSFGPACGSWRRRGVFDEGAELLMEGFLVSITTISIAEIGDRTQLLSLVLAARYRRPWPIIAGILCATLANHGVAGALGVWFGSLLKPQTLGVVVGISMIAMALWTLKPDKLDENESATGAMGAFLATLTSFFIAKIADRHRLRRWPWRPPTPASWQSWPAPPPA